MGDIKLSQSGSAIVRSLIYTALISIPATLLLTWIGYNYTARFPRLVILMQVLALVFSATVGCFASGLLLTIIGMDPRSLLLSEFRAKLPFTIVISLMTGMSIFFYEVLRHKLQAATLELRTKQVEQERAYKLLAEAQLSSLESRIHPHFLFNTLNSIAALIPKDPQLAEDTISKLASLLRFSLNANHSGLIPLSQELKIVRDYLEIEKTRFGPRLNYSIAVPSTIEDVQVPPLALQSLVENAVKHVVAKRPQGGAIQICGSIAESSTPARIRLEVVDDGPGFSLDAITPQHGLGNLIARLELLFGTSAQLAVARVNEKTAVRLSFPA